MNYKIINEKDKKNKISEVIQTISFFCLKKNILATFVLYTLLYILLIIIVYIVGVCSKKIFLDENQQYYLFSSSAQIAAALFGLTLTAYAFREDILKGQKKDEPIYSKAIEIIQKKYFYKILFIAFIFFQCIIVNIIAICVLNKDSGIPKYIPIFIDASCVLLVSEIILIIKFSIDMINPQKLDKELKKFIKLSYILFNDTRESNMGDLKEFLGTYNNLEKVIRNFVFDFGINDFRNNNYENGRKNSRIPLRQAISALSEIGIYSSYIAENIQMLVDKRNKIVHNNNYEFKVTEYECNLLKLIYALLLKIYSLYHIEYDIGSNNIKLYIEELNQLEKFINQR